MTMEVSWEMMNRVKSYVAVILLQIGFAGMSIIAKSAVSKGMSHFTLAVYRNAIATVVIAPFAVLLEKKVRPRMTFSIFTKILLLGLLEPVLDQNLFYMGVNYTTATFTAAMCNILPALTFLMAWILRLEKVDIRRLPSQAKVVGTVGTVGGAMLMTLINGPQLRTPWTKEINQYESYHAVAANSQNPIKGALMISAGCVCWASFIILQAFTLKSYPAELSLTALICATGTVEAAVVTLAAEWGNASIWSIHWDSKFLAAAYGGIVCSGIAYFLQGVVMKEKGPVFVTAFNPLSMILVAIMSTFILVEQIYLGRVIGALVIVIGLYLVIWGKSKDQLPSKPNRAQETPNQQQVVMMNSNHTVTSNVEFTEFTIVDIVRVTPTNEHV